MRQTLTLALLLILAACGGRQAPAPTPPPAPTVPSVGEILAAPTPGLVRTVGYMLSTPDGAALVDGLRLTGPGAPEPLGAGAIWLGRAPALPAEPPPTTAGELSYVIVEAAGRLEGPGSYGPGGRYSYALAEPALKARSPRDLTLPLLLSNSGLYEGQPVRLQAQLLVSPGTALLIERLGPGGVPEAQALQVKLAAPPDEVALSGLQGAGRVRYGPVEVVGLWRAGTLYPMAISPR
jgi:hypothetical protein